MNSNLTTDLKSYTAVTAAYWVFTLTDGALRMLVLLHFHKLGYSPIQLASLFLLYEVFGVVTNLFGGMVAAHMGLKVTLASGLLLQVGALSALSFLNPAWSVAFQVTYVVVLQGASGIAKDLTKLSAKTTIKVVVPKDANGHLFRWVALLTGSKNALKGVGFFLGGTLLSALGFRVSLLSMAACVLLACVGAQFGVRGGLGQAASKPKFTQLFSKSAAINWLSAARVFLFGARDVWFVVALPVFFYDRLGFSFVQVGSYLAAWVIGYGLVQSVTPRFLESKTVEREARSAVFSVFLLALVPVAIVLGLESLDSPAWVVLGGLGVFGVLFAVNSSLHSYLILAFSDHDKAAANVGFYYTANASGRLMGTVLSGSVYQAFGMSACLLTATALLLIAFFCSIRLPALVAVS